MTTFEGICKFCGSMQPVMAESQEKGQVKVKRTEGRSVSTEC